MNNFSTPEIFINSASEHHDQTLKLIQSATRHIVIHCHDLTNRIYNHPDIATALTRFIIANSANRSVKILVQDINSIITSDHKILETCRRLSSSISIHKISTQHASHHTETFILVDSKAFIIRDNYMQFSGNLINDPKQAKVLLNLFNELWSQSEPDLNLNQLYI